MNEKAQNREHDMNSISVHNFIGSAVSDMQNRASCLL